MNPHARFYVVLAAGLALLAATPSLAQSKDRSGFNLSGSYTGRKWSLGFNLNNNINWGSTCTGQTTIWSNGSGWINNGWAGGWGYPVYYQREWNRQYPQVTGFIPRTSDANLVPGMNAAVMKQIRQELAKEPPPPPPPPIEQARAAVRARKFDEARTQFRIHLKEEPNDLDATRQYGASLLEAKHLDDAVALWREVYRKDPTFADRPYQGSTLGQDAGRIRDMVAEATKHANKTKSASAWLAVVVLLQSEGRLALASKPLERAREAGLEREVADRLAAAIAAVPRSGREQDRESPEQGTQKTPPQPGPAVPDPGVK